MKPDVLDRLALIVQYAAASYCNYNNENPSGAGKINCHGIEWNILRRQANQQINVCPRVEALNTETLYEFREYVLEMLHPCEDMKTLTESQCWLHRLDWFRGS